MSVTLDIEFCKNIAKLFYAIASADKRIDKKEYDTFKSSAKTIEHDFINSGLRCEVDMFYHLTSTFNALYLDNYTAQTCYDEFVSYKRAHEAIFSSKVKDIIQRLSDQIASSFSDKNKSELMMLAKLSIEFKT